MGIQIFMTTHDETIASYADNTINLRNVMGKVEVIGNG
jgi:ABC-type lipoprotein export system ATPase subunit